MNLMPALVALNSFGSCTCDSIAMYFSDLSTCPNRIQELEEKERCQVRISATQGI